jgi:hypothetical protein
MGVDTMNNETRALALYIMTLLGGLAIACVVALIANSVTR